MVQGSGARPGPGVPAGGLDVERAPDGEGAVHGEQGEAELPGEELLQEGPPERRAAPARIPAQSRIAKCGRVLLAVAQLAELLVLPAGGAPKLGRPEV